MEKLQEKLGYRFVNPGLLRLALTHKSMGRKNNERLEFLGDAVIDLCVRHFLFHEFPDYSEGDMSMISSNMVCHDGLLRIAMRLGLADYLDMAETDDPTFSKESALSDAVEAITAAIYLDGGYRHAARFILNSLMYEIERKTISLERDAKTLLQEELQAKGLPPPAYTVTQNEDGSHSAVVMSELLSFSCMGTGTTRKEAEKDAAKNMLWHIEWQQSQGQ